MQQQQQPVGMAPFSPAGAATSTVPPSPITSRPPEEPAAGSGGGSAPGAGGSFDHEPAGDEGERSGSAGNRWPRQETLALLKIRSEMDAAFREAALKGPLWEEVSRKLAAMGYNRSAKKCREKFENVDKYYKRTKDGRAGRGDGKTYRFFSELEALHGGGGGGASSPHPVASLAPTPVAMAPPAAYPFVMAPAAMHHAEPQAPPPVVVTSMPPAAVTTPAAVATSMGDVSFSSSSDDDDGEDTDETGDGGKRKRRGGEGGGGSSSNKMMRFFEGLMRQVMERQEEMQQRFIEAIERREQDRMIREEAWRRQEVARLAREQDALAQERAMAASRDAAVVSFIQRITGQTIPMPPPASVISFKPTPVASAAPPPQHPSVQLAAPTKPAPPPPPPPPHAAQIPMPTPMTTTQSQPQPQPTPQPETKQEVMVRAPSVAPESQQQLDTGGAPSPSRWPKAEVHALIQMRTELEARYQDAGPKGPLWEDISAGMRRMGYNRSAKRCKEKWENINKYFKKVKESNKNRPEDSKTCPYFHQLDALYRSKQALASAQLNPNTQPAAAVNTVLAAVPLSSQTPPHHQSSLPTGGAAVGNSNKDCNGNGNGCAAAGSRGCSSVDNGGSMQTQQHGNNGTATTPNKDDMMMTKETPTPEEMPQPVSMNDSYVNDRMDAGDSDSMDDEEDDFDDDDEDDVGGANNNNKVMHQYEIQFQRQHQQSQSSVVRPNATAGAGSGPGPAATTGSFLTMVHH